MESESFESFIERMKTEEFEPTDEKNTSLAVRVAAKEIVRALEKRLVTENIIQKVKEAELRRNIDVSLDEKNKANFLRFTTELMTLQKKDFIQ